MKLLATVFVVAQICTLFSEARFLQGRYRRALPPPYLSVNGHQQCLGDFQASQTHLEKCLPLRPLVECPAQTWTELQAVLSDGKPEKKKLNRRSDGRPAYLDVEGYKLCLNEYQASSTHTELCRPFQKPAECADSAWEALATAFQGATCPPPLIGGLAGLPPAYLTVNGYQDCLLKEAGSDTHEGLCLPDTKPSDCEDVSFEELKNVFQGPKCQKKRQKRAALAPPNHLQVPHFKKCLGSTRGSQETWDTLCMPSSRKAGCPKSSWDQLQDVFEGEECPKKRQKGAALAPPNHLQVPHFKKCLGSTRGSQETWDTLCMPSSRKAGCPKSSWDKLQDVFDGEECPKKRQKGWVQGSARNKRQAQLGTPAYLDVPDFHLCLGEQQKPGQSHTEWCKPSSKPQPCPQASWDQLTTAFNGDVCAQTHTTSNIELGDPQYLQVEGFQACLLEHQQPGTSHTAWCLPAKKPEGCLESSWDELQSVFDGENCLPDAVQSRQSPVNLGTPLYLQVPDFDKCLGEHKQANDTHTERCLPSVKPGACPIESWNEIVEVFNGDKCLRRQSRGLTLTIPKPAYLSVDGQAVCLSVYKVSATLAEKCLPIDKPTACSDSAWEELEGNFGGIRCPKAGATAPTGVPPPYLAVEGHEDCLDEHQVSPTHSERCLPQSQPFVCSDEAWEQLEKVFDGIRCPLLDGGAAALPPQYLFVVGFDKCLDVHQPSPTHSEYCLPQVRPDECLTSSWSQLLSVFEGIRCSAQTEGQVSAHPPSIPDQSAAPGQLGGVPPAYLEVEGHQDCLSRQTAEGGSHTEVCLPSVQPDNCIDDAWNKLNVVFANSKCREGNQQAGLVGGQSSLPPAYLGVEGHEDCLDVHQPTPEHAEKCLPQYQPSPCTDEAWRKLLQVFDGIRCATGSRSAVSTGALSGVASQPDYLAIDGQQNCLGYHQIDDAHTVKCIPHEQPAGCETAAWQQLLTVFSGIGCSKELVEVLEQPTVGAPAYLSIEGHEFCLGTYRASDTHSEKCLPADKLPDCEDDSWNKLQTVFNGIRCPVSRSAPTAVAADVQQEEIIFPNAQPLPIGYQTCVGEQLVSATRMEKCLPSAKPESCSESTWEELETSFSGPICRRQPNVLPPHYLTVSGYEKCFISNDENDDSNKCLPKKATK